MVNDLLEERLQPLLEGVASSKKTISRAPRRSSSINERPAHAVRQLSAATVTSVSSVSDSFEAETLVHGVDSSLLSDSDDDSCISSPHQSTDELLLTPTSPLGHSPLVNVSQLPGPGEGEHTVRRNRSLPVRRRSDGGEAGTASGKPRPARHNSQPARASAGELIVSTAAMKEFAKLVRVMEGSCRMLGSTINDILDVNVYCFGGDEMLFWVAVACPLPLALWN